MSFKLSLHFAFSDLFHCRTDDDFSIEPKAVKFNANETRVRLTITAFNDAHEEGFENFTLQLLSDEAQNRGTVNIVRDNATVSIEDDDG